MVAQDTCEKVIEDVTAMMMSTGDTYPARLREATANGLPLLHTPVIDEEWLEAIIKLVGAAV